MNFKCIETEIILQSYKYVSFNPAESWCINLDARWIRKNRETEGVKRKVSL